MTIDLHFGDCIAGLRKLADRSVDHFIFDPPYNEKTHAKGKRSTSAARSWTTSSNTSR